MSDSLTRGPQVDPVAAAAPITCPICNDAMRRAQVLSCGHSYCAACIYTWLLSPMSREDPSCPVCRRSIACMPTTNVSLQSVLEHDVGQGGGDDPRHEEEQLSTMREAVKAKHATLFIESSSSNSQDADFWRMRFLACVKYIQRQRESGHVADQTDGAAEAPSTPPHSARQTNAARPPSAFATLVPDRPVPQVGNLECVRYMNRARLAKIRA
ncbi:hypothetical protein CYMTET_19027 [Cymbomonas tetramitiformis]|uniref:RING-type domain-containing protein n=1 Tax=Cymbomonas tetramitiformis TaxID=36881 RepID=A0AAE0L5N3_9CHLO|nr:hypothetical protein CYMTET_19027 [Cymbomonas tetramitiformis]